MKSVVACSLIALVLLALAMLFKYSTVGEGEARGGQSRHCVVSDVGAEGKNSISTNGGRLSPSEISPAMFEITQPDSAVFWSRIKLSDVYLGPFRDDKESYWNVYINAYIDNKWEYWNSKVFFGYVLRSSQIAKRLIAVTKDGKEHYCLLRVSPVKQKNAKSCVYIDDFELVEPPQE